MMTDPEGAATVVEAHPSDSVPVEVTSAAPLATPEPVAAAEPVPPVSAAEPAPDGSTKPPKLPDWAQKQLNAAAAEKRIAEREAKRLADELAAERKKGEPPPAPAAPAEPPSAPAGGYKNQAEFDAAVAAEADRRNQRAQAQDAQSRFDTKSNETYTKGKEAFGDDFDTAAANLRSVGAMTPDLLEMVFATDDPSKVLYDLGSDPDRASALVTMTPAARAIEIAKLAVTVPKRTPTPLSNAPRPVPPVDGSARVSNEPSDADDDETFFKKREAELAQRRSA